MHGQQSLRDVPAIVKRAIEVCKWYTVQFDATPEYTEANGDREEVLNLDKADNISSLLKGTNAFEGRHKYLLLDIDVPAALLPSSTRNHNHLYVELPEEISTEKLAKFLRVAAEIGLIDVGYAEASISRRFTSLRLPWVKKRNFADAKE